MVDHRIIDAVHRQPTSRPRRRPRYRWPREWSVRRLRVGLIAGAAALTAGVAVAVSASQGSPSADRAVAGLRHPSPVVPVGDLLRISMRGWLLVLDHAGREIRRMPGLIGPNGLAEAIQLAPDRRHGRVWVWNAAAKRCQCSVACGPVDHACR